MIIQSINPKNRFQYFFVFRARFRISLNPSPLLASITYLPIYDRSQPILRLPVFLLGMIECYLRGVVPTTRVFSVGDINYLRTRFFAALELCAPLPLSL